jgi:hypothetical protein
MRRHAAAAERRVRLQRWLPVLLAAAFIGCDADPPKERPAAKSPPAPETFFAVLGFDRRIVEVATATGEVVRTVVDLPDPGSAPGAESPSIDSLTVDTGRTTLWFGVGYGGPLYRVALPDGGPERIGDGEGITVSPDGKRLAFARSRDLVVRQIPGGEEKVFDGFIGDLGGRPVSWAANSRTLAVEIDGADVSRVVLVDTDTGAITELKPRTGDPLDYTPQGPWFRKSDGQLVVVCCTTGEVDPENPSPPVDLVVHNPANGEERERSRRDLEAWGYDYDPSGTHQLLVARDAIYRRSNGNATRIPGMGGARLAVW